MTIDEAPIRTWPNPGLSASINRFLANLDILLPRRSRRGDRTAQLLHSALSELTESHGFARDALRDFLEACEDFHRRQFWVDEDFVNHDDGACWFPIVLAGHEWRDCLQEIMRLRLPESLGRARRIVLRPIGRDAPQTIRVVLRGKITGVSEAAFNRFVSQVRPVASRLESVYDAETTTLEIQQGHEIELRFEDNASAHLPTNGGIPAWLETLLDINAVEQLDLRYPLIHRDVPTIAEFVSVICVLPDCPIEWRSKERLQSREVFQAIADSLGQGVDDPFHLFVTALETEWLPLADAFVSRALTAVPASSKDSATDDGDIVLRHVSRMLTLHPGLDMRDDSEYDRLRIAFRKEPEQGHAMLPIAEIAALPREAADSIARRLNDIGYVAAWAQHFRARAHHAMEAIVSGGSAPPSTASGKTGRGVPTDFLVRINTSIRDFAAAVLASLEKSLDVLVATETLVHEADVRREKFQHLAAPPALDAATPQDAVEAEALRAVTRLVLASPSIHDRVRGLATLIYALTENDAVSDSERYGRIDDRYVIATLLADEILPNIATPAVQAWRRNILNGIDAMATRSVQHAILKRYETLVRELKALCIEEDGQPPAQPPGKKSKPVK